MKPTNTFDAHRLAKFARIKERKEITENLLFAYFTESRNLSDVDTLATIAEASGLDKQEALQVINDKSAYANDVRVDEAIAQQYQISGVPYFIINQSMLFQVHNHLKLLLVHFSKCGKKRILYLS